MRKKNKTVKVSVYHDEIPRGETPNDEGPWRLYSFNTRHLSFKDPSLFATEDLLKGLKEGRIFGLECFQHGQVRWALSGEQSPMCQCPWDNQPNAGWLILEDAETQFDTKEQARTSARAFVEVYNDWCNGEVYSFEFPDDDARYVCGFIIGLENVMHCLVYELDDDEEPEFVGAYTDGLESCWDRIKNERDNARKNVTVPDHS